MCETDRNSQLVCMHTMQDADYTLLRRARREVGGERERVMHLTLLYERLHAWGDIDRVESCGFSRRQVEAAVRARCKLLYMSDTAVNSPPRSLLVYVPGTLGRFRFRRWQDLPRTIPVFRPCVYITTLLLGRPTWQQRKPLFRNVISLTTCRHRRRRSCCLPLSGHPPSRDRPLTRTP